MRRLSSSILVSVIFLISSCGNPQTSSTTPSSTIPTSPATFTGLALSQYTTNNFTGSGNCAFCHSDLKDAQGKDVSIDTQWRSSMMANASKDPFWQANVASEVADNSQLSSAIEDACALCHMPAARTQAVVDGIEVAVLGDGFLSVSNSLHEAAMDGNTCSLCHQIESAGLGTSDTYAGNFSVDTKALAPDRPIYGPFPNPVVAPMQSVVGFTPTQGSQASDAGLCGTCHTVYTPFLNDQGQVGGMFPEQTNYLEWKQSIYGSGVICQNCHMPTSGATAISNYPSGLEPRQPFFQHVLVGGNVYIISMIQANAQAIGAAASTEQLQSSIDQATNMLGRLAAQVVINNAELNGNALSVTLTISDLTGHKFPSGFPSRRAWVHFIVKDSNGNVVFESGAPNTDGSISGNAADSDESTFEPHYDIIANPGQVQIYEPIMGDVNGKPTYILLRGSQYLKDNRILPNGFNKTTSLPDTAVVGSALTDTNFIGGSDQVTYQVSLTGGGPYTVTAEVMYQTISYQFAQQLFTHNEPLVTSFEQYYIGMGQVPQIAASASKTVS